MDIKCAGCNEPWEHYHVRYDMIYDIWDGSDGSETHRMVKKFLENPTLDDETRSMLEYAGWRFGRTVFAIHECPCCKDNGIDKDDLKENIELMNVAEDLLGDDIDGLISTISAIEHFKEPKGR